MCRNTWTSWIHPHIKRKSRLANTRIRWSWHCKKKCTWLFYNMGKQVWYLPALLVLSLLKLQFTCFTTNHPALFKVLNKQISVNLVSHFPHYVLLYVRVLKVIWTHAYLMNNEQCCIQDASSCYFMDIVKMHYHHSCWSYSIIIPASLVIHRFTIS